MKDSTEQRFELELARFELEKCKKMVQQEIEILETEKKLWVSLSQMKSIGRKEDFADSLSQKQEIFISELKNDHLTVQNLFKKQFEEIEPNIIKKKKENHQIITENRILLTQRDKLKDEMDNLIKIVEGHIQHIENTMADNMVKHSSSHSKAAEKISDLTVKINSMLNDVGKINQKDEAQDKELIKYRREVECHKDAILKLEHLLLKMCHLPMSASIKPEDLMKSPEKLIMFVDSAIDFKKDYDENRDNTTLSETNTGARTRKPPLSKDVASLISRAGRIIEEISAQFEEQESDDTSEY